MKNKIDKYRALVQQELEGNKIEDNEEAIVDKLLEQKQIHGIDKKLTVEAYGKEYTLGELLKKLSKVKASYQKIEADQKTAQGVITNLDWKDSKKLDQQAVALDKFFTSNNMDRSKIYTYNKNKKGTLEDILDDIVKIILNSP